MTRWMPLVGLLLVAAPAPAEPLAVGGTLPRLRLTDQQVGGRDALHRLVFPAPP